jgi:hypothetical protein
MAGGHNPDGAFDYLGSSRLLKNRAEPAIPRLV